MPSEEGSTAQRRRRRSVSRRIDRYHHRIVNMVDWRRPGRFQVALDCSPRPSRRGILFLPSGNLKSLHDGNHKPGLHTSGSIKLEGVEEKLRGQDGGDRGKRFEEVELFSACKDSRVELADSELWALALAS